jgi:hypothetical protein
MARCRSARSRRRRFDTRLLSGTGPQCAQSSHRRRHTCQRRCSTSLVEERQPELTNSQANKKAAFRKQPKQKRQGRTVVASDAFVGMARLPGAVADVVALPTVAARVPRSGNACADAAGVSVRAEVSVVARRARQRIVVAPKVKGQCLGGQNRGRIEGE